jgi:DNA-directed RNA polymerase subunit alpha
LLDFANPHSTYEPPLARGFGYTFGNSLRRVLLSSLEGAAISTVRISGVEHEFSTVPHVKEDVTDIILNLKKIVFVLHGEADEHEVNLVKDGPGEVTAGDIQLPAAVEVVNPEAHIATLEDGGRLDMRLTVRRGRGYATADDNKPPETILGLIPIDSIFSPVRRVAYKVEAARVGQRTDFDKLILEVETNGALEPKEAVHKAAEILREELLIFLGDGAGEEQGEPALAAGGVTGVLAPGSGAQKGPMDDTPIEELELGVRSYNCLKREGIETVGDLISRSEQELLCIPNFGRKSIEEVRERLDKFNLRLKGD